MSRHVLRQFVIFQHNKHMSTNLDTLTAGARVV